jgi:hypothetical protein
MVSLGKSIMEVMVDSYGQEGVLERVSDTFFFQSLSNVLGFDWNSSGTTTVLCGVLQQVFDERELGLKVVGGKGGRSRKTQTDLICVGDSFSFSENKIRGLQYASRMAAKVDSAAVQAGYQLYHHCMFVSEKGDWTVVQQGMNQESRMARRYHWLGMRVEDFVEEPHESIVCDMRHDRVLDLTALESNDFRKTIADVACEKPEHTRNLFMSLARTEQRTLSDWDKQAAEYTIPRRMDWNAVERAYELQPENFEGLLSIEGVGPATVRGLALISQLVYGSQPSWKDPVRYSFAFGGKDGVPYPVNRESYDKAITVLEDAVRQSRLGQTERMEALRRLDKTNSFTRFSR